LPKSRKTKRGTPELSNKDIEIEKFLT